MKYTKKTKTIKAMETPKRNKRLNSIFSYITTFTSRGGAGKSSDSVIPNSFSTSNYIN